MKRRVRFALVVLASQILLIAVSFAWIVHMAIIAANGQVLFVERNSAVLWGELGSASLILVFALYVLILQIRRLGERRGSEGERRRSTDAPLDRRASDRSPEMAGDRPAG